MLQILQRLLSLEGFASGSSLLLTRWSKLEMNCEDEFFCGRMLKCTSYVGV